MPRKNKDEKFILAAGEIAHYTVCPEAWRLSMIEKKETLTDPAKITGRDLHQVWAKDYHDSIFFTRSVRLIIEILLLLVLVTLLKASL